MRYLYGKIFRNTKCAKIVISEFNHKFCADGLLVLKKVNNNKGIVFLCLTCKKQINFITFTNTDNKLKEFMNIRPIIAYHFMVIV